MKAKVKCPECKEEIDSKKIHCTDVCSNVFGEDVLTFDCPICKKKDVQSTVTTKW